MIKIYFKYGLLVWAFLMGQMALAAGMNAGTSVDSQENKPSSGLSAGTHKKNDMGGAVRQPVPNINVNLYGGMNNLPNNASITGKTGANNQNNPGLVPLQFNEGETNGVKSLTPNGQVYSYPTQDGSDQ